MTYSRQWLYSRVVFEIDTNIHINLFVMSKNECKISNLPFDIGGFQKAALRFLYLNWNETRLISPWIVQAGLNNLL